MQGKRSRIPEQGGLDGDEDKIFGLRMRDHQDVDKEKLTKPKSKAW